MRGGVADRAVDVHHRRDLLEPEHVVRGELVRGLVQRASAFEVAVLAALAPFYNESVFD